ncbi:MAG: hypothetical protein AVDCRST_MAG76-2258, partial [uncultured Acidimicrobiales bacterium]
EVRSPRRGGAGRGRSGAARCGRHDARSARHGPQGSRAGSLPAGSRAGPRPPVPRAWRAPIPGLLPGPLPPAAPRRLGSRRCLPAPPRGDPGRLAGATQPGLGSGVRAL